jgi:hypothetical protein
MAGLTSDWIGAAQCCEGPRPVASFGDLPRAHQHEMLRFVAVAAASSAFFVTLWILSRPIPSRSLVAHAALPQPLPAQPLAIDLRPAAPIETAPRRPAREPRLRASYQLVSAGQAIDARAARSAAAPERRRNVFSRFFRTIIRTVQPPAQKTISTS